MREVEFLGQWITSNGVGHVKANLNVVHDWETPINAEDIRPLLQVANHYRWFVPGNASNALPLTMLTKKDFQWHWCPINCNAFEDLKTALCIVPLLLYPDPTLPYTAVSDASGDAMGGVLMQDQGDGLNLVVFMIRALKPR